MKKVLTVVFLVFVLFVSFSFADNPSGSEKEMLQDIYKLYKAENYTKAVQLTARAIKAHGETQSLLQAKFHLLLKLEKSGEALEIALKMDKAASKKSPWTGIDIATLYAKSNEPDKAIEWLNTSVERGFNSISMLRDNPDFAALHKHPDFNNLIKEISNRIGIGKTARNFSVKLLSGKNISLTDLQGKVVLVDFWATWCGPCRKEIPHLKQYYSEFKDQGFEIIGISLDRSLDALQEYVRKEKISWPLSFSGKAWKDDTAGLYGVRSIPSMWLIDKKGILRHFDLRGEKLRRAVKKLLAE